MLVRELFTSLGLKVDEESFAKGELAIGAVKAGLGLIFDNALNAGAILTKAFLATKNYEGGMAAATKSTVDQLQVAADKADTVQAWIATRIELIWAKLFKAIAPVLQYIATFFHKNGLFIEKVFEKLYDVVSKNWNKIKIYVGAGALAITALLVALKWEAIKSAAATAAAWLAAAWPFILIGGLIAGLLIFIDDLRVYLAGGDSMIGRFKKRIDAWLAPKKSDPGWLTAIKNFIHSIGAALSKKGAVEGFFASIWGWLKRVGAGIYDFLGGSASSVWEFLKGINWEAAWINFKMVVTEVGEFFKVALKMLGIDLDAMKDKAENTDWHAVWIKFEMGVTKAYYKAKYVITGIVNFFRALYHVITSVVEAIEHAVDAIGRFGAAVGSAFKKVGGWVNPVKLPAAPAPSPGGARPIDLARAYSSKGEMTPAEVQSVAPAVASWANQQSTAEEAFASRAPVASAPNQSSVENNVEFHLYGDPEGNRKMVQEELSKAGVLRESDIDNAAAASVSTE